MAAYRITSVSTIQNQSTSRYFGDALPYPARYIRPLGSVGSCGFLASISNNWAEFALPRELSSENIEVVTGNDLAPVELANLLQHLPFAASIAAVLCARLVTACIAAMVQHQEIRLRLVRDLRKLPRRGMEHLTVLLPFRRDFLERSLCICLVN